MNERQTVERRVMSSPTSTHRGGATRSEKARLAILRAASELVVIDGYEHLTIEGIAARAKVGKPTIYRWWPSKGALLAECLVDEMLMPEEFTPPKTDDVVADITTWLLEIIRFVNRDRNAVLLKSLVAAAVANPDVGTQLSRHLGASPDSVDGRLRAAVASGQLVPDAPIQHITEFLLGAIVIRIVSDTGFVDADAAIFVRIVLAGSLPAR
jgi:AcrR family transcriptional regulator